MDQNFSLTISGGGSVYPQDGSTVDELIKNADVAMYKSKSLGKNQYNLCSPQMKNEIMKHTILTNDLHRALEKDQLYLEYQPQVDIRSGEVIGFEALLRWRHPKLGLIMPSIFIPLAEQSGLIISMGQMVIEKACSQMKKWHDLGKNHWVIAVNLSMKQFKDPNLISIINDTLEKLQLPPHALELEITESIDIHDDVHFLSLLHKLKDIGVKISLDDFGTKYSSLNRLKIMPIDKIKIDIQFVRGIGENPKDEGIIDTIIKLASHLETEVLAEGVENLIQYKFLQDRNCHLIQGYYFHRPLSMENVHQEFIQ